MIKRAATLLLAVLCAVAPGARAADDAAGFYAGRTIGLIIGTSAGGGYDLYARVLAKHMGRHIAGNPTIVPQNMPGAGTLRAMLYLNSIAPKDGSVIGTFSRSMPIAPLLGVPGANFDARKLTWLGSITKDTMTCLTWKSSAVKSWDEARKTEWKAGGEGRGADPDVFATVLKNALNAKVKLVTGYPGTADITLAMERGELDGLCGISYSTIRSTHPQWLADKQINLLVQGALEPDPLMPGVPFMLDLAADPAQAATLRLILLPQAIARPFVAPPGIPADRAKALQDAFAATMADPEFLSEAARLGLDVNPLSAAQILALLNEAYATPKDVIKQAVAASGY